MTPRRVLTLLFLVVGLAACGASAREKSLKATLITTNAMRDGFLAFDTAKQDEIVAHAVSFDAGTADLAKYRSEVQRPIVDAFTATYKAIAECFAAKLDEASFNKVTNAAKDLKTKVDAAIGAVQ